MVRHDTSMGGDDARFPTTTMNMVLAARKSNPESLHLHIEKIISRYWKPIYSYIRRSWNSSDQSNIPILQYKQKPYLPTPCIGTSTPR